MMDSDHLSEATRILNIWKDTELPGSPSYLHPYTLLTALITHAPTPEGKQEIAKDVVDNGAKGFNGLIQLTDYFWTTLLVPRAYALLQG